MGLGRALKKLGRAVDPIQVTRSARDESKRAVDRIGKEFRFGDKIGLPSSVARDQKIAARDAAAQEKKDAARRRRQLFARAPGRARRSTGRQSTILTERLGGTSTPLG